MRQLALLLTCAATLVVWALPVFAQVVDLQLGADRVEVGSTVQLKLSASGPSSASNPRLTTPQGMTVSGPAIGTSTKVSIVNGRVERSRGVTATWHITPTREGEYTIGPATVTIEGRSVRSNTARLVVVPRGALPQNQPRRPTLPFDDDLLPGFGGRSLFDELFGRPGWHTPPEAPPEYQIDEAPDRAAFLRAVAKPAPAVVGQQITLEIFAYGGLGRFNESPGQTREPRTPDFYAVPLRTPAQRQQIYPVNIDGREYLAVKVRELALFPLKSGELTIGPMQMGFYGSRYLSARNPSGLMRQSNEVRIQVSEPPSKGRPPSYRIGDVGDFQLSAEVSHRELKAGESLSVQAKLQGHGHFPLELDVPQQHGIEWLEPTVREAIAPDRAGRVAGEKTFTYVVKVTRPGKFDLGTLSLAFYHPPSGDYRTAKAALGELVVHPAASPSGADARNASADGASSGSEARLSELSQPRSQLRATAPRQYLTDRPWYWGLLLLSPLMVWAAGGVQRLGRAWRRRSRQQQRSWQRQVDAELAAAKQALARDPETNVGAQLERALLATIEGTTSIRGRGLLRSQLAEALASAGVPSTASEEAVALLQAFEEGRFGAHTIPASDLLKRTRLLVREFKRLTPSPNQRAEVAA